LKTSSINQSSFDYLLNYSGWLSEVYSKTLKSGLQLLLILHFTRMECFLRWANRLSYCIPLLSHQDYSSSIPSMFYLNSKSTCPASLPLLSLHHRNQSSSASSSPKPVPSTPHKQQTKQKYWLRRLLLLFLLILL
jgi:hypothetical protein